CKPKVSSASASSTAFQGAPPANKTLWDTSVEALKTNGYVAAYGNLQKLRGQTNLDAEQTKAVDELLGYIGTTLFEKANKGDAEATKALQEINNISRRR